MNKKFSLASLLLAVGLCASLSTFAYAADDLNTLEQKALRDAVEAVAPSVLQIETVGGLEKVGDQLAGGGPCSGLVITEDGYLLSSSYNFVHEPTSILASLPSGKRTAAKIVARDHSRNLVLLKVNAEEPLPVPTFVPRDELRVGQWAIAVGKSFSSTQPNASIGVVSAMNRVWGKAIQSDAKISPNNYGGALIDIQGRVIGVITSLSPQATGPQAGADWYDSGIGFAVPVSEIMPRLEKLQKGEDLRQGLLGISLKGNDVMADVPAIGAVRYNSPAQEAGIEAGDIITAIQGKAVVNQAQLKHLLEPMYAGDVVALTLKRGEETVDVKATLIDVLIPYAHPFLGILPIRDAEGVVVRDVLADSPAAKAGLAAGDVIVKVNDKPATSADELRTQISTQEPDASIKLVYRRGEEEKEAEITLATLPTAVPGDLPAAWTKELEQPAQPPKTGEIEVRLAEEPNAAFAWVPDDYNADRDYNLVVLVQEPGEVDKQATIDDWKEVCQKSGTILLSVSPASKDRWTPSETGVVRKCIEQLAGKYSIAPLRTTLVGSKSGGAMAYMVAFENREAIAGVVTLTAPVPRGVQPPDNDPLHRLAIFTLYDDKAPHAAQLGKLDAALAKMKFPVTHRGTASGAEKLTADDREAILRWLDSLDRI
ncbi:PDZ domain-containing protein [Blastopirellula sp. JC732]|uniref:PDZ domain-containing protein n=1 Tax=Blastopirellula sediminis TaxID=2894196 RepID=A0A9X1SJP7_9BACT|nr:PDZ domain-containing protein [Blastopirellula sediminis]MCC9604455.1 PDZ domain-containing protein [Blastopirellula sediminis]MCC9632246.1 PDZ domain-containing protein [Blastopirellula sediminis]